MEAKKGGSAPVEQAVSPSDSTGDDETGREGLQSRLKSLLESTPNRRHESVTAQEFEAHGGRLPDGKAVLLGVRGNIGEVFYRRGDTVHLLNIGQDEGRQLGLTEEVNLADLPNAPTRAGGQRAFPVPGARERVVAALNALGFDASEGKGTDIINAPRDLMVPFERAQKMREQGTQTS